MTFKILPTKEFLKGFRKLESEVQQRIRSKVREIAQDPTRYKHLHYALKGSCRIRIGTLRVLFSYDVGKRELYLENIITDHHH